MASDREYSSTDAAHGLPGFSSNSHWAETQETDVWSHSPVQPGPKAGFHDPVEAAPQRAQLWGGGNEPASVDADQGWDAAYREPGGIEGQGGKADGAFSAGRHDGTERGNSPWFRGGPH